MRILASALLLLCLGLTACSSKEYTPREKILITEVKERLSMSAEETISALEDALLSQRLFVAAGFSEARTFETNTLRVHDTICDASYMPNAPTSCHIKLHGQLEAVAENTTILTLRYKQYCSGQSHIETRCPGSKGEELLFDIHQKVKATQ